jgi:hypothetical protein
VPLDAEALLPALRMPRQGAVGKANTVHRPDIVQHVHNTAGMQEPQTAPRGQGARDGTGLDIRGGQQSCTHPT